MNPTTHQITATWLRWRHGRVIAFPWETIEPEMDLLAYAEAAGRPLVDVAAEVSSGRPGQLLLGLLQTEFRGLLESFLNHHEWGLDGGPLRFTPGYPRARLPLGTMRLLAEALNVLGSPEMDPVLGHIQLCDSAGDDVPPEVVAGLLAAFYSVLPALARPRATRPVTLSPPPAIDPCSYATADPAYRAPVADFIRLVHDKLSWAFRFVLLHGSLATEDYLPGISDFDTFAIVRDDVAASAERLLTLRAELLAVYPCLYRIDPQQHHGVLLCAGQDALFYPQAFFPFTLFDHGRTIYREPGYDLTFAERDDSYERANILYRLRQNYRWLASQDWEPCSQFLAKFHVNLVLLTPALYFQRSGEYTYKRDSFTRIKELFGPDELRCLSRAEEVRARDLYGVPLSWPSEEAGCSLESRIQTFHRSVRDVPPSPALRDLLGRDFWRDASAFLDLLCDRPAARHFLQTAAGHFTWGGQPRRIAPSAYPDALRRTRRELKALDADLELWDFGSVSQPGISDLDLLIEAPDDVAIPAGLNGFVAAGEDGIFQHPPSMILRRSDLLDAGKLYPIFDARRCREDGTSDYRLQFGRRYAPHQLCALAEMACCYFFRQTLAALLERRGNVRQILLSTSGLKHSLRVLRANSLDVAGLDDFAARVGGLREAWFDTDADARRRETLGLMFDAVSMELSIVDSVRDGVRALADCAAALAPFPRGAMVGVLFDEVIFIKDWERGEALSQMLAFYRRTGRLKLVFPAEIAVLLAYYAALPGVWQQFLQTQFVHSIADPAAISVAAAVEDRRRAVEDHYQFLHDRGLEWGGLPNWSFDPTAPDAADAAWTHTARDILLGPRAVTLSGYIECLGHVDELLQKARGHVDAQRWDDAVPLLEEVLRLAPHNPAALYLLGVCFVAEGGEARLNAAAALLSQALDAGFDGAWGRLFRSQAHLGLGNLEAAEADLNAAPCRNSEHPAIVETRAALLAQHRAAKINALLGALRRHIDAGDRDEALRAAGTVLEIDPQNAAASYLQAFALQAGLLEQVTATLAAYQRALDGGFDPFWVYYNRSQLRLNLGDLRRANADLDAARRLKPDHDGVVQVQALIDAQEHGA